jgi:Phytanoyl-CoA dioxygenase (PhyH)
MKAEWRDLGDKGFVVVPQFLSTRELELIRSDYDLQNSAPPKNSSYDQKKNSNFDLRFTTKTTLDYFEPKIRSVSEAVLAATGIDTDVTVSAMYFAIDRGINTPWHQDHESYFLFKNTGTI